MENKENIDLRKRLTSELISLQQYTSVEPYSVVHRLKLAKAYKSLGYPDLAVGDAYKALLLIDEVAEEGEYHDEALAAAEADFLADRMASLDVDQNAEKVPTKEHEIVTWTHTKSSKTAYDLLIGCLIDCGCLRSAFDYTTRAKKAFPGDKTFETYNQALSKQNNSLVDLDELPDKGLVRREQYPWNDHEPNRFSEECLTTLNEELASIAPKLEVRVAELPILNASSSVTNKSHTEIQYMKQLGLFAKEDIPPGDQVLKEKSLLTAVARLHDLYCDACSVPLPSSQDAKSTEDPEVNIVACEECNEVFFCSADCHDLAQDRYHPSSCGVNDQSKVPAVEAADYLYSRLLVRALALADTQEIHPLELKEVRYIWGDYHGLDLDEIWQAGPSGRQTDAFRSVPQTLPFSFKYNILTPQQILEKMDINIFTQSHRYDTWIFNTLYAKFRGTASARQGLDGRPEISAVHPMWCLANHSCDPNVGWEWRGTMLFWTREKLVDWEGRNPSKSPGLKKGEEVYGHYCDVRLPVKERREWAVGALGGDCMCERCIWEEAEERRRNTTA
ncbi:Nn.00g036410.m01.CDS01 [Neocucurbitaria sp. VM-36]